MKSEISFEDIDKAFDLACESMSRLNKQGSRMMKKYKVHGATDVTGFGILGHLQNLVSAQKEKNLKMVIHSLPIIKNMYKIDQRMSFNLSKGFSAETSGGLMMLVPKEISEDLIAEMRDSGEWCWEIGEVIRGEKNEACLEQNINIIEV